MSSCTWTGHRLRLDWHRDRPDLAERLYEELVAELGAAFLAADRGEIWPAVREDNAAYIGSWLKAMRKDKRLIFAGAADAVHQRPSRS